MAVTHVATVSAYSDSSFGPLSMSSTLDVATGDYLIGFVGYETRSSSVTVTDGGSISLTVGTEFKHPSSTNYSRMIYGAAASANSTATALTGAAAPSSWAAPSGTLTGGAVALTGTPASSSWQAATGGLYTGPPLTAGKVGRVTMSRAQVGRVTLGGPRVGRVTLEP